MKKKLTIVLLGVLFGIGIPAASVSGEAVDKGQTNVNARRFESGRLTLNKVPENFVFGSLPLSTNTVIANLDENRSYGLVVTQMLEAQKLVIMLLFKLKEWQLSMDLRS